MQEQALTTVLLISQVSVQLRVLCGMIMHYKTSAGLLSVTNQTEGDIGDSNNRTTDALLFPKCKDVKEYVNAFSSLLTKYEINASPARLAAFLGQFGHETMGWTRLVENTNYTSPERLMKVFQVSSFTNLAKLYAGKPVNIANRVYANRYGNGDEKSGDGYRYRGRGVVT